MCVPANSSLCECSANQLIWCHDVPCAQLTKLTKSHVCGAHQNRRWCWCRFRSSSSSRCNCRACAKCAQMAQVPLWQGQGLNPDDHDFSWILMTSTCHVMSISSGSSEFPLPIATQTVSLCLTRSHHWFTMSCLVVSPLQAQGNLWCADASSPCQEQWGLIQG